MAATDETVGEFQRDRIELDGALQIDFLASLGAVTIDKKPVKQKRVYEKRKRHPTRAVPIAA